MLYGTNAFNTSPLSRQKSKIQAARNATGATKLTSLESLYVETGWESLALPEEKNRNLFSFTKCNDFRICLISCIPTVGSTTRYSLRNESDLQTIAANSQQYYNTSLEWTVRSSIVKLKSHLDTVYYSECGAIEDTKHFLLNCNLFQNWRGDLPNIVRT